MDCHERKARHDGVGCVQYLQGFKLIIVRQYAIKKRVISSIFSAAPHDLIHLIPLFHLMLSPLLQVSFRLASKFRIHFASGSQHSPHGFRRTHGSSRGQRGQTNRRPRGIQICASLKCLCSVSFARLHREKSFCLQITNITVVGISVIIMYIGFSNLKRDYDGHTTCLHKALRSDPSDDHKSGM